MEAVKITKEMFAEWTEKNDWLKIAEGATPQGPQANYLTPTGNIIIVIYDLKGNLYSVGQPVVMPPQQGQGLNRGLSFKGPLGRG